MKRKLVPVMLLIPWVVCSTMFGADSDDIATLKRENQRLRQALLKEQARNAQRGYQPRHLRTVAASPQPSSNRRQSVSEARESRISFARPITEVIPPAGGRALTATATGATPLPFDARGFQRSEE